MLTTVTLGRSGIVAVVDAADYPEVVKHRWTLVQNGPRLYAREMPKCCDRKQRYMHQFLTGFPKTDHIDGNGLNNRRQNLRPANDHQNGANARKRATPTSSKYKGVCWDKRCRRWSASIGVNRRSIFLGRFDAEEEAAKAYDEAARKYFGEYARPNLVDAS